MVSLKLESILKPEKYIFKLPSANALNYETEIKEDCFFYIGNRSHRLRKIVFCNRYSVEYTHIFNTSIPVQDGQFRKIKSLSWDENTVTTF